MTTHEGALFLSIVAIIGLVAIVGMLVGAWVRVRLTLTGGEAEVGMLHQNRLAKKRTRRQKKAEPTSLPQHQPFRRPGNAV